MSGFLKKWFLSKCPEYSELQLQNQDLHAQCSRMAQSNSDLMQKLNEQQALQHSKLASAEEYAKLNQQIREQNDLIDSQKQLRLSLAEENTRLHQQIQDLLQRQNTTNGVTSFSGSDPALTIKLKTAEDTEKKLRTECSNLEAKYESAVKERENLAEQLNQMNDKLTDKENELVAKENELIGQKFTLSQADEQIKKLQSEKGELQQANETLRGEKGELQQNINDLEKANKEWYDHCEKLMHQHVTEKGKLRSDYQTTITNLHTEYAKRLQEKEDELKKVKEECQKTLQQKETECKGEVEKAQKECREGIEKAQKECREGIEKAQKECREGIEKAQKDRDDKIAEAQKDRDDKIAEAKKDRDDKIAEAKKEKERLAEEHQEELKQLFARENLLLGANIADFFRTQSVEDLEMRKYHLFLSLIYSCDQENNFAGVQNVYLLLDDVIKARYRQEPAKLNEKRQFIRKIFNENVHTIEIDSLPEVGKNKLDYNQSHYTVRGSGNIITSVESPCLIYKINNNVRPGLIHCA